MSKAFAGDDRFDADCQYQNNTITLDYDGEKFKGYTTFPLKHIISSLCNYIPPFRTLTLRKIIIVAKSKRDYGAAKIQIGRHMSHPYLLNDDYRPVMINIRTARRFQYGFWKLYLEGKIKVEKIILHVEEGGRRH